MTPTLTRPRPVPLRKAGGNLLLAAAVGAVLLVAVVMVPAQRLPSFADRITVVNPSHYHIEVDVRGGSDRTWFSLGGYSPESTRTSYQVIDQGSRWVFRFTAGGRDGGDMIVTRGQLQASRWRVTIPDDVANRLAAQGVTPSAP
ncbi:MAG: hypothetical protein ACRD2W_02030 [Acidimicrobiales bacterium]